MKATDDPRLWKLPQHVLSVQFSSVAQLCPTLCNPMNHSMPGLPVHHHSRYLLKLMSIESVMASNHLILCHPLLLPSSIFPSIRVFSSESVLCIRWPKYWSFSCSISLPVNIQDWFPLGWTGWISLQSKGPSRVFCNTTVQKHQFFYIQLFFIVQLSHSCVTTGKTIAWLDRPLSSR